MEEEDSDADDESCPNMPGGSAGDADVEESSD